MLLANNSSTLTSSLSTRVRVTVRDHVSRAGRFPGIKPAIQVGDVAETSTPQHAGGDRTPIPAFAVHHQKFPAIQIRYPRFQFSERDAQRFQDHSTGSFSGF